VDNTPAFVPILLMFALIAMAIAGFWHQDRGSQLWRKEYVSPPKDTPSRPFSEIKELAKMGGVLVVLTLIGMALWYVFLFW